MYCIFVMGLNPRCSRYNQRLFISKISDIIRMKEPRRLVKYISTCIPSTTIAGAAQHLFNTCLRCILYRGCRPTHQIPVQCWASVPAHCWFNAVNRLRHPPNTNPSLICCILCANTWHSPNAVQCCPTVI